MALETTSNLVVNGDCEAGPLSTHFQTQVSPTGWVSTGTFDAVAYGIGGPNDMNAEDSETVEGGLGYFAGGPSGADSSASQTIDVTSYAAKIDAGGMSADIAGDFGGFENQNDAMSMTVTFYAADGTTELGHTTIGGIDALDRVNTTLYVHDESVSAIPVGTRSMKVELFADFTSGAFNDAYADNIYVALQGNNLTGGFLVVDSTHDFSADALGNVDGIAFRNVSPATGTFSGEQIHDLGETTIRGNNDANTLFVDIASYRSFDGTKLTFDHWNEAEDRVIVQGGALQDFLYATSKADTLNGGDANDFITVGGGADIADAGAGFDTIEAIAGYDRNMKIDGGADVDTVEFFGGSFPDLVCKASTFKNVETFLFFANADYSVTLADGNLAAGGTLNIITVGGPNVSVDLDGSKEKDGHFAFNGGGEGDTFTGGTLSDTIQGEGGADVLAGGGGNNRFVYEAVAESTGVTHDTIKGFDARHDKIDLSTSTFDVNALGENVTHGMLRGGSHFDTDLKAAISDAQLHAHDAVLFTPDSGNQSGHTFLIIDANGNAGYQGGHDFVIELFQATHMGVFSIADILD